MVADFSPKLASYIVSKMYNAQNCEETEYAFFNGKNNKNNDKESIFLYNMIDQTIFSLTYLEEKFYKYHVMCKKRIKSQTQNESKISNNKNSKIVLNIVLGCFMCIVIVLTTLLGAKFFKVSSKSFNYSLPIALVIKYFNLLHKKTKNCL